MSAEMFLGWLHWLENLPFAVLLQNSTPAYVIVNAAHILSIALLLGCILTLDLRLLGAFRSFPLAVVGPLLSRMAAWGLGCALVTGFLLFSVKPTEYIVNTAFLVKVALIAVGVVNALWLHAGGGWKRALAGPGVPASTRVHSAVSLVFWLCVLVAGRTIGFV
jgi:hypothetical protein